MVQAHRARRAALLLFSYVITITTILQSQIMNSNGGSGSSSEPFLTHLDLQEGSNNNEQSKCSTQNSCSETTYCNLNKLIAKINENSWHNAMIDHNITIDDGSKLHMPGLHLSSFNGHKLAFLGDSTLYWLGKYFSSMLHHQHNVNKGIDVEYYNMKDRGVANNFVKNNRQFMIQGIDPVPPFKNDKMQFAWFGMHGNMHGKTEEAVDKLFTDAEVMKPDIIVANMAFHWFHLCGYSEKMCPSLIDSPLILRWLHYRESWLQRVYDFAIMNNVKLLLFKTANFICGSARTGDWLTGDTLYQKFDNVTLANCVSRLEPLAKDLSISTDDLNKYCKFAQFTDIGSKYVNEQMVDFVSSVQQPGGIKTSDGNTVLTVGIYNDHDIEECATTEDAIHHKVGATVRIRLLSNTIENYLKC